MKQQTTKEKLEVAEKNAPLLYGKFVQLVLKIEWLIFLKNHTDREIEENWDLNIQATLATLDQYTEYAEIFMLGELPIRTTETFPPFPFQQDIMERIDSISETMDRSTLSTTPPPGLVCLALALETEERFISFYTAEWERSKEGIEKYTELTLQFIKDLAQRLYKK